jgi:transcriptional regulator with PAS, ATPase and Fis domain
MNKVFRLLEGGNTTGRMDARLRIPDYKLRGQASRMTMLTGTENKTSDQFLLCSVRLKWCIIKNRFIICSGDIEERMSTIKKAADSKEDLDIKVKERTAELAAANEELQYRINELGRMRDALVKRSGMLEAFFKHSISPLVFLDKDFNFIRVNEAYARACNRDVWEFPGHNHLISIPIKRTKIFSKESLRQKCRFMRLPDLSFFLTILNGV